MEKDTLTTRKDILLQRSAVAMLVVSALFAAAGFIVSPRGQIHESVLWYCAQCFIYAGSALGIGVYISNISKRVEDIQRNIDKESVRHS